MLRVDFKRNLREIEAIFRSTKHCSATFCPINVLFYFIKQSAHVYSLLSKPSSKTCMYVMTYRRRHNTLFPAG